MRYILLIISFINLSWTQVGAGMFSSKNESIIGIEGTYDNEEISGGSMSSIAISGSYVLNGNLEFIIGYVMGETKNDDDSSLDFDTDGFLFGGNYHIKENEQLPFNIKLGGFYGDAKMSADWLDDLDVSIKTNASGLGAGIYKNVYQEGNTTIIGFFDFLSVTSETKISVGNAVETDKYDVNQTNFGLAIRNRNIFISPSITRGDGESDFSITFGLLLPQKINIIENY